MVPRVDHRSERLPEERLAHPSAPKYRRHCPYEESGLLSSSAEASGPHPWSRCRPDCDLGPLSPRHLLRPGGRQRWLAIWPGLLVTAVAAAVSLFIAQFQTIINGATVAVALGVLLTNLGLHRSALRAGTHIASHRLLRIAVVLLGLQLGLPQLRALGLGGLIVVLGTVAITFAGTLVLGRLLRVSRTRSLLVATGFSICGASAVAAMSDVADADEDDIAVAIALVTLCGSLAIVILPLLRQPLGLDPVAFGNWVGASVHDVGQTVATASRVPDALSAAVVVKLSRVVLLAPLVAGVGFARRRQHDHGPSDRRPPILPLFVAGFLAAVAVTSTGLLPASVLEVAHSAQEILLVAALFGLGTTINLRSLRRTGGTALLLGLTSWILVAGVAYLGVRLLGR